MIGKTKRIPERLPDITPDFFEAGLNVKNWARMKGYCIMTVRLALAGFTRGKQAMKIRNEAILTIEAVKGVCAK